MLPSIKPLASSQNFITKLCETFAFFEGRMKRSDKKGRWKAVNGSDYNFEGLNYKSQYTRRQIKNDQPGSHDLRGCLRQ